MRFQGSASWDMKKPGSEDSGGETSPPQLDIERVVEGRMQVEVG
jgi:hypothetical protein